jgi:phosphate transport system substrate-binding protein
MRRITAGTLAAIALAIAPLAAQAAGITGAGATFPYPIYAKWADAYKTKTGIGVNYQSIGSGAGIAQIKAKTIDFGASDMPLAAADLDAAGLVQFPAIVGGVVPVVNVDGIAPGTLRLTGRVLAGIYLGNIKRWNDAAIAAANPGLTRPDQAIAVVHRSDGSGTTFIWTDYLSKSSAEWKSAVGAATAVAWRTGMGGKGNEGVAAFVQRIKGSIGYVEYAYAKRNGMAYALVQNRDGAYPRPEAASFQAAAANADWTNAPAFHRILTDQPGQAAWPITGASFILMQRVQDKPQNATEVLKFFAWAFRSGSSMALELDYVPLPEGLVVLVERSWKAIVDANGKAVFAAARD